ncbi:MAG TPA: dTDP-4-dehydrorhamnose 3,5-epimerase [Chitinophagaceae bacterium]|nr:dTDP-4-dehydrorhamnose 3,5-epimerase [Chitinophagaceae bacterium]
MKFSETALKGSFVIEPDVLSDHRGWFMRTYCENEFGAIGHDLNWVQMNHSFTAKKGTCRGLHYQLPPFSEIKLIRCVAGAVFDVLVDLRRHSPGYLQWTAVELSAENKKMVYIPAGFAHGFQALTDNAELIYLHSAFYTASAEGGIRYDDKKLSVDWPLAITEISERDKQLPLLNEQFTGIDL